MTSEPEVLRDGTIGGEEALGLPWGLEPLHAPFTLARGLVGVFRPIGQVPVLPVLEPREPLPLRGPIAVQPIGDDDSRDVPTPFEQLPKELRGSCVVAAALHENIEPIPVLIHRPPQVMSLAVDREENFVEVPRVTRPGTPAPELIGILLPKLAAPLPDRLVGHRDATCKQELFNIPITEAETEIQPDRVTDNLGREAVVLIAVRCGWSIHAASMPHWGGFQQVDKAYFYIIG